MILPPQANEPSRKSNPSRACGNRQNVPAPRPKRGFQRWNGMIPVNIFIKLGLTLGSLILFVIPAAACSTTSLKSIYTFPARGTLVVSDPDPRPVKVFAVNGKGAEKDVTVQSVFTSSNPGVLAVSANGGAAGLTAGYANITVAYTEGKTTKTAVIPVTVIWLRSEGRAVTW